MWEVFDGTTIYLIWILTWFLKFAPYLDILAQEIWIWASKFKNFGFKIEISYANTWPKFKFPLPKCLDMAQIQISGQHSNWIKYCTVKTSNLKNSQPRPHLADLTHPPRGYRVSARLLADTKFGGHSGKTIGRKTQKSTNSCILSWWGVGAQGIVTKGENWRGPGTNTRRSQIVFCVTSIVLSLVLLGIKLLGITLQSVIGSPGNRCSSR